MLKLSAVLLCFMCSVSFANVSGKWIGWGDWIYEGSGVHCNSMTMNFVETDKKLIREGGYFDCQVVGLDLTSGEWTKQGTNLLSDGVVVGTITENSIHLTEQYSENVKIVSDISMDAGHFDYSEVWYDQDDIVIYEITGRLFRKAN